MASLSTAVETEMLEHYLNGTQASLPAGTFLALFTTATDDAGGGTEVSTVGTAYARVEVNTDLSTPPYWTAPADDSGAQESHNNSAVEWAEATDDWGTVTHIAIVTTASGAFTSLFHGALDTPREILEGDTFRLKAGEIKAALA